MTEIEQPSTDLDSLAGEIRREHEAVVSGVRATIEAAIRCGDLLREAKAKVGHGGWGAWLAEEFPASDRTARVYMRLANHYADRQLPADLTIAGALKQLAAPASRRGDTSDASALLAQAKEHMAAGDEHYQRAFEEIFKGLAEQGVKFTDNGVEFPDDSTRLNALRVLYAALPRPSPESPEALARVLNALSPKIRWDLGDVLEAIVDKTESEDD